jgi:hypothetical protein
MPWFAYVNQVSKIRYTSSGAGKAVLTRKLTSSGGFLSFILAAPLFVFQAIIQEATFSYDCHMFNPHPYPAPTIPWSNPMSNHLDQRRRGQQIEALKIQQEHMLVVLERHRAWSQGPDGDDIEIDRARHEIIDLIEKTVTEYDRLLVALRRPIEADK